MTADNRHPPAQDDENWLNLLAGRAVPNADGRTRQEAHALRQAILAQAESGQELSAAELAQGRERLLFALRRAVPEQRWWQRPALLSGIAAALVGIAVLPLLMTHQPPPSTPPDHAPSDNGPFQPRIKSLRMPTVIRVAQPATTAQALAADLSAVGISTQPKPQGQSWFLDAPLPKPLPPEVTSLLARYGIKPPLDSRLLVELAPHATQ